MRVPVRTRWWWTAATASSAGMGASHLVVAAVRQDEDVVAFVDRLATRARGPPRSPARSPAPPSRTLNRIGSVMDRKPCAVGDAVQGAELLQLLVGQDGEGERHWCAAVRLRVQQVALRPDRHLHRHHDLLADGVDRRVGDLGEQLLEVVVEQLRPVGQDRERRVVAHRADRLRARVGHGVDRAGGRPRRCSRRSPGAAARSRGPARGCPGRGRQVREADHVLADPVGVGLRGGDAVLQLLVGDDALLRGVHEEHAAGLQAALGDDLAGRDVQDARLRGHHHPVVRGDPVARRAQAVAVQRGAHEDAVRERDRGRAVPGLHQRGVELVERALLRRHRLVAVPRLRDQHHQRVRQRPAGQIEQLQDVVEHRGVRAVRVDRRQDLVQLVAEERRAERRLAGMHPVDVAAQRVDLAVVGDEPVRVRAAPAGERVRGEARVHHADGALERRVVQVRVEVHQLGRVEHPLVDDRPGAHRGHVELRPVRRSPTA